MNIKIGPPVSEDNFYPRPDLISRLLRALEHSHVAFLGPRRTGKTSCLRKIVATPPTGYVPILLNLETYDCVESWFSAMLEGVRAELKKPGPKAPWLLDKGAAFLGRIEELTIMGQGIKLAAQKDKTAGWRPLADDLLRLLRKQIPPSCSCSMSFPSF